MRGLLLIWVLDLTSSRIYRGQSYAKYGQYDISIQSEKGKVEIFLLILGGGESKLMSTSIEVTWGK